MRSAERCKAWKIQRMKDCLQQNLVIDVVDVQFLLTEEKCFRRVTKEGNDGLVHLESINA